MTLHHFDGFDAKASLLTGAYSPIVGDPGSAGYVTGRFGSGFAITGTGGGGSAELVYQSPTSKPGFVTGLSMQNGSSYGGYECILLGFWSGTSRVLVLRVTPVGINPVGRLRMVRTSDSAELGQSSVLIPTSAWHQIEVKVVAGLGTAGTVIVRQNGVVTMNIPGVNTGSATLTGVSLSLGDGQYAWNYAAIVDDWWVCDTVPATANNDFLGDLRVLGISPLAPPAGNGTYSQLLGSDGNSTDNCALVNEIPPNTSNYVGSLTPGQKDTYVYADIPTTYTVKGVRVVGQAAKTDAGPISGRLLTRSGGNDYGGPDCVLSPTPTLFGVLMENDPATGAAWTTAGVNAVEFGWEVRA